MRIDAAYLLQQNPATRATRAAGRPPVAPAPPETPKAAQPTQVLSKGERAFLEHLTRAGQRLDSHSTIPTGQHLDIRG